MNRLRTLLAEDHPLIRAMLKKLLCAECEIIAMLERGDEIASTAERLLPDVVILDVSLPGISGIQILPAIRAILPQSAIIILTTHDDRVYREEAFRRGADAYVLKARAGVELLPAIMRALRKSREIEWGSNWRKTASRLRSETR